MKKGIVLLSYVLCITLLFSQEKSELQTYIGSYLLAIGEVELKVFNNLYSQKAFYNDKGVKINDNKRSTFYTAIVQSNFGVSHRINLGFDIQFKSVKYDPEFGSTLDVFQFNQTAFERTVVAYIGPKIRWIPFPRNDKISLQSSFYIPVTSQLEGIVGVRPFIDHDGYQWWNELFYSKSLGAKFYFFGALSTVWKIDTPESSGLSSFTTPLKAFINFFPNSKWTVYSTMEVAPTFGDSFISAYYIQEGLGLKYGISESFELEILYTNFIAGKQAGAGETYNLGLRTVF